MLSYARARRVAQTTVCVIALLGGILPGEAATKSRPRQHIFDDLVTPSMLAPSPVQPARAPANGARFFSINSVLARLDGKVPADGPVQLAMTSHDDVATDAPADLVPIGPPAPRTSEPFGLFTFRAPQNTLWRKWNTVKRDIAAELAEVAGCKIDAAGCSEAARRFNLMIADVRGRDGTARLETANRLINTAIRYTSDLIQYGEVDVWSAPVASLASGRGDCEDYAIAKYVLLREAGVAEQDLRVLLVRDNAVREDHAVLAVRREGGWTVLDNRRATLFSDSDLPQFTPLVALDSSGVSLFASPYLAQRMDTGNKATMPRPAQIGPAASAVSPAAAQGAEPAPSATPAPSPWAVWGAATRPVLL